MTTFPRMEATLERIKHVSRRFNINMQPPAENLAIERLKRECSRRFAFQVPERYCHLLRLTDGVEWNGARFFAAGHPGRTFPTVIEETMTHQPWLPRLILGNMEDQYFCFDQGTNEYQVYAVGYNKPYRRFKEFDELFAYAFEGRWPEEI